MPYLAINLDRDDDFAVTVSVAGDMAREGVDIMDELCDAGRGDGAADALADLDRLARDFALKRAQHQLTAVPGVENIESGPVDGAGGRGERVEHVPEQRSRVGRVADPVALFRDQVSRRGQELLVRFVFAHVGREVAGVGVGLRSPLISLWRLPW